MRTILFSCLLSIHRCACELNSMGQETYSIDSSWAIKSPRLTGALGNKQLMYDTFIEECREAAGPEAAQDNCDDNEENRFKMNNLQPMSMRNYTELGFAKIRAPEEVMSFINEFWEANKHLEEREWKDYTTYHNVWEAPTTVVNAQDENIPGGGNKLTEHIWEASRRVMEEWTGQHLAPCSLWGIRIYPNNSILTPHVDRNPLVTSAIINVAQDVDEDWPLEVWGHDGKPYNITMKPGDMVLYESHSIIHGRPFPMRGKYYANIFVHFEPIGALPFALDADLADIIMDEESKDTMALGLPPYIIPGSEWEKVWREENPKGWQLLHSDVHTAAQDGDWKILLDVAIQNPAALHEPDENGWHPLHEAVRAGYLDVVKFLLDAGSDVNQLTADGDKDGATPLSLAKEEYDAGHPMLELLESYGAVELEPEL